MVIATNYDDKVHCKCIESAIVNKRVALQGLAILTRNLLGLRLALLAYSSCPLIVQRLYAEKLFNYASFVNTVCDLKNNTNAILVRPQSSGK